jgi:ABC-type iron transport system FetAB permease component
MLVTEISLWGAAVVALFVIVAVIVLAFIDKKMLRRMLVIFGATVVQMAVVGAAVWVVYQTHAWWSYLLWYLLILVLSICWVLYPLQSLWKKMLQPVGTAIFVGSIVVGGSTMLCLPITVFMTVYSVLMACMTASMIQTMGNYQRSLHNPEIQRQTWRERMLPNIRSMGQPLVVVIPTLFAGMLLGGVSVLGSLIVVFLLTAAAFVANVLAGVIALQMLSQKQS